MLQSRTQQYCFAWRDYKTEKGQEMTDIAKLLKECRDFVDEVRKGHGYLTDSDLLSRLDVAIAAEEKREPDAWMVWRDVEYESREFFLSEADARKNACLGIATTHVLPLYRSIAPPQVPDGARIGVASGNALPQSGADDISTPAAAIHSWVDANDLVRWPHCGKCGIIQQRDGSSDTRPCKGAAKVTIRSDGND